MAILKLRTGTYFPEWLLQRRKRAESALITVVADCYLAGIEYPPDGQAGQDVGHRLDSLSKSQVSLRTWKSRPR